MKNIVPFLFLFVCCSALAQKMPDYGMDKIRIVEKDKVIQVEIKPGDNNPKTKSDRFYYWYSANAIHATQGGFSGKLLNGLYNEYYLDKNIKQQGFFKNGLKDGVWKTWKEDGTLAALSNWKNGLLIPEDSRSFLQKLNIFKKKNKQSATTDTLQKH